MPRGKLLAGSVLIGTILTLALLSLVWTPLPPQKMQFMLRLKPPFTSGLLGTDAFGRDVLSMLMAGTWNSLAISGLAVALGTFCGTAMGLTAAALPGPVETLLMRAADVIFAFPPIISAMILGALLGPGGGTAVIAIAVFITPVFARIACGAALQIWARDYILAARTAGKGWMLITLEHVLPNIADQIVVQATLQLGIAILTEAGLSFLGLSLPPPAPSLGRMLADAQTYLAKAPWLAVAPGLAIALIVLGLNLLGDGLGARLDPKAGDGR